MRNKRTHVPSDPSSVSNQSGSSEECHGNKRPLDILAIQIKALSVLISASTLAPRDMTAGKSHDLPSLPCPQGWVSAPPPGAGECPARCVVGMHFAF